jgi:hypothetical protein
MGAANPLTPEVIAPKRLAIFQELRVRMMTE